MPQLFESRSNRLFCLYAVAAFVVLIALSGCAVLHKVQLSDIDNREGYALVPFEIKVSETGVDLQEAAEISRGLFRNSQDAQHASEAAAFIGLFQMGPRTGNAIYSDSYAQKLVYAVHQQCPSGRITGVQSIRETRKYPVISGEIVKIAGYCMRPRKPASDDDKSQAPANLDEDDE